MAKEDEVLPVKMGSLEIESIKLCDVTNNNTYVTSLTQANKKSLFSRKFMSNSHDCSCSSPRIIRHVTICKKKHNQSIIKEPVLKLLQNYNGKNNKQDEPKSKSELCGRVNKDMTSLCALVDNCNQLRISSRKQESTRKQESGCSNDIQWWKKNVPISRKSTVVALEKTFAGPSCSQQALNPPCDVTIDELASYFETLVHIPKKMSSMAEMMYI